MNKRFYIISFFTFCVISTFVYYMQGKSPYQSRMPASSRKGITEHNYTRSFLTLNSTLPHQGLENFKDKDSEYIKRLFGILINEAHKLSVDDWYNEEHNVYKNYYTFLLASLQVPFHESGLSHFRRRNKEICSHFSNDFIDPVNEDDHAITFYQDEISKLYTSLEQATDNKVKAKLKKKIRVNKVKLSNATYLKNNIAQALKLISHKNPFPHCSKFKETEVSQILFSNDYADIGIMMINAHAHPKVVSSGMIFNFDEVIKYGLNHLYKNGFNKIANNSSDYKCLKGLEQTDRYHYATSLIRGVWAGRYNSGSVRQTCRYTDSNHKFKLNDIGFLRSYNKIMNNDNKLKSFYHHFLPDGSIERQAFFEIINNVKNSTNNHIYLDKVLKTNYLSSSSDVTIAQTSDEDKVEDVVIIDTEPTPIPEVEKDGNKLPVDIQNDVVEIETSNQQNQQKVEDLKNEQVDIGKDIMTDITDEVIPENDVIGDLPTLSPDEHTHIITGKFLNIRGQPEISSKSLCGNTKLSKRHPIEVKVLEFENPKFVKIDGRNIQDLISIEHCLNLSSYFISKSFIKEIKRVETVREVKLTTWVWARNLPSYPKGMKIKVLNPEETYVVIDEVTYHDEYHWIQILLSDGQKVWIYANDTIEDV